MGFPGGSVVKNLPVSVGDRIRSLGQEDPLEKETANPLHILSEKYHGQRSLTDCSPRGHKELDTTEQLNTHTENISSARMFQIVSLSLGGWEDSASLSLRCQ